MYMPPTEDASRTGVGWLGSNDEQTLMMLSLHDFFALLCGLQDTKVITAQLVEKILCTHDNEYLAPSAGI